MKSNQNINEIVKVMYLYKIKDVSIYLKGKKIKILEILHNNQVKQFKNLYKMERALSGKN